MPFDLGIYQPLVFLNPKLQQIFDIVVRSIAVVIAFDKNKPWKKFHGFFGNNYSPAFLTIVKKIL